MSYTNEEQAAIDEFQIAVQKFAERFGILTEPNEFLGDWYMIGALHDLDKPGWTFYWRASAGGDIPPHRAMGLIEYARNRERDTPIPDPDDRGDD